MSLNEVPPPYTAVQRHGLFPTPSHDETARFNFLANFNKYMAVNIGAGNKIAYESRVLPNFIAENGREPNHRNEIRKAMNKDAWHQFWSALKRNSMEMRQQNGRSMALRNLDKLDAIAHHYNDGATTLKLDENVKIPIYQSSVDIHCQPGSYHGEERPGDVSAGANYDSGIFATTAGGLGALSDGGGQAIVAWIKKERPEWRPKRILDLGCTIGHNLVPIAKAFPDAEVIAIDTAAPILRYAHARAKALGADNITFMQVDAENMNKFADDSFDWVQTTMFLHELSGKALPKVMGEAARVLKQGGLMLHIEQPQYSDQMPLFEQFMRDWDAFNNNEPFWTAMHSLDLKAIMNNVGLPMDSQFVIGVRAVVDTSIFPEAPELAEEDMGRAPVWNAYGAWKPLKQMEAAE